LGELLSIERKLSKGKRYVIRSIESKKTSATKSFATSSADHDGGTGIAVAAAPLKKKTRKLNLIASKGGGRFQKEWKSRQGGL